MLKYFENKTTFALTIIFTICAVILWLLCLIENSVSSITAPIILFIQTFVIVSAVFGLILCWGLFFFRVGVILIDALIASNEASFEREFVSKWGKGIKRPAYLIFKPLLYGFLIFFVIAVVFTFPVQQLVVGL